MIALACRMTARRAEFPPSVIVIVALGLVDSLFMANAFLLTPPLLDTSL